MLANLGRFAWAPVLAVLVTLGLILPAYWVYLLTTVAISALIARSIGLLTNQAGIITLCQMSFAAIGGWVASWFALSWPTVPFPLIVLIGGVVTAPIGLLIGGATARIRGVELAVVTLGFATALDLVMRQGSFPSVRAGTPVIPAAPFDDPRWFFALAWISLTLLQIGLAALNRTSHGLGWTAIRLSERGAAALGVRVAAAKATAFGIGALFAGVAGGLLAGQYGLLTTEVFRPLTSMVHLATAVLCGAGLFGGAVLAGVVGVFGPEVLRRLGLPLDVAHGLLALGAIDVLRRGRGGLVEQLDAHMHERAFRNTRTSCDISPMPSSGVGRAALPAPVFEVVGLTVDLGGHRVLDAVDLAIDHEGVHALIGPNGAGKSTFIDAVSGFLPNYGGKILLDGESVDGRAAHERARLGIRRTFQQGQGIDAVTVDEYLRLAGAEAGMIAAAREFLGLPDGNVPIRLMDIGSQRTLDIAAALASKPRVVLLDEPGAGLGEAERIALATRVRHMPAVFGVAVLLIEHDMSFVREASAHVTVLDDGRVISTGPVSAVLNDPPVIGAYLGKEITE